ECLRPECTTPTGAVYPRPPQERRGSPGMHDRSELPEYRTDPSDSRSSRSNKPPDTNHSGGTSSAAPDEQPCDASVSFSRQWPRTELDTESTSADASPTPGEQPPSPATTSGARRTRVVFANLPPEPRIE